MSSPSGLRAMVLAAGFGTRLRPLTDLLPKALVPVLGVPLVEATLDRLAALGVERAVVNLHHLAPVLREALDGIRPSLALELDLIEEAEILGTGGGLRNAAPLLRGARAVLLVNGDTLFDADLEAMVAGHLASAATATLLVRENPDPVAYAPVWTDEALRVHRIAGLPAGGPASDGLRPWLFAGVHVLDPAVLELLPAGPCDVNRALHPRLIERGSLVRAFPFSGAWSDVGTPARLLAANRQALAKPPGWLLARAELDGHERRAGSLVGRDARIARDAVVTGSVLGHGTRVASGAQVERSLLFAGTEVGAEAVVRDTVLGPGATVGRGKAAVSAFVVGDRSLAIPHGGEEVP